jgi:RNA polymerase sigma-70 factor (ECF subfamily)
MVSTPATDSLPQRSTARAFAAAASALALVPRGLTGEDGWPERVRSGDVHAFDALFCRYWVKLCTVAYRYGATPATAEDVVQEVFARIWAARAEWTVKGGVAAYLFAAVRSAVAELPAEAGPGRAWHELFTMARTPSLNAATANAATASAAEQSARAACVAVVHRAMTALPERARQVLTLRWCDGLAADDVASALDIPPASVDRDLRTATRAIQRGVRAFVR